MNRSKIVAILVAPIATVAIVFASTASAAPGGEKGPKPKSTPTVTATETAAPAPTPTVTVAPVLLNCYLDNGYVIADYMSSNVYDGAQLLYGDVLVGAYAAGSNHVKFEAGVLQWNSFVRLDMKSEDGSQIAACEFYYGYVGL